MGPLAQKVMRDLRKAQRSKVVDLAAIREAREQAREIDALASAEMGADMAALPPSQAAWMRAFGTLSQLGTLLLGSPALRKLADRVDAAQEEYMPGGPPMSPVLDSVFMTWMMVDLTGGPRRESLCQIIIDLARPLGLPEVLKDAARILSQSRMGVYRTTPLADDRVALQPLGDGERVEAQLAPGPSIGEHLWLTRLLPPWWGAPSDDWVVWTTPYVLPAPDAESQWREYLARTTADRHPSRPSTYWLDYIMDGYLGVTDEGDIALTGVPDRPQTLPHSEQFEPPQGRGDHAPIDRVRIELMRIADSHPFPPSDMDEVRDAMGAPPEPHSEQLERMMHLAYRLFGQLDDRGRSPIDLLQQRGGLGTDERAVLHELAAGWFSAFEILRVRIDEGMELRDVLRRKRFWLSERSGTRQANIGDLVVGWVMVEGERVTLEGAALSVPAHLAPTFGDALRQLRDHLASRYPKLGWKRRAGLLAEQVVPLLDLVLMAAPPAQVVNRDGDEIVFSEARYAVVDEGRAREGLRAQFDAAGDGLFDFTIDDTVIGQIELRGERLIVRTNSRPRLERMRALLERTLGDAVQHQLDSHEDMGAALKQRRGADGNAGPPPLQQLPPALLEAVDEMLLSQMRSWLDQPIPALKGKTPRLAVRTKRGRDDVTHLLARQEQIFRENPQTASVDLSEIWSTLGLKRPESAPRPRDR